MDAKTDNRTNSEREEHLTDDKRSTVPISFEEEIAKQQADNSSLSEANTTLTGHNTSTLKAWNRALRFVCSTALIGQTTVCSNIQGNNESEVNLYRADKTCALNGNLNDKYTQEADESREYNIEYCIRQISYPDVTTFRKLRRVLENAPFEWIAEFVRQDGLGCLLDALGKLNKTSKSLADTFIQLSCVECAKIVMNSPSGLACMIENKDFTRKFVQSLEKDDPAVKIRIFELLSALCVYSPEGYSRVLDVLEDYKAQRKCRYRFAPLVEELRAAKTSEYRTTLLSFINCIVISTEQLDQRVRIRNEFLGLKIADVLSTIRKEDTENPDLVVQLDVFDQWKANDDEQLTGPDGVDLNDHLNVFHAVFKQVCDTPQELVFLAILQHLLQIDPALHTSDTIWDTTEKLIYRATQLQKPEDLEKLLVTGAKRLEKAVLGPGKHCDKCQGHDRVRTDSMHKHTPLSPSARRSNSSLPRSAHGSTSEVGGGWVENGNGGAAATAGSVPVPPPPPPPAMNGVAPPPPPLPAIWGAPPPPPPPAPPRGGPPPPPPLGNTTAKAPPTPLEKLPQQMTPKPQVQVRKLQWSKIPAQKVVAGNNIWSRIGKECKNIKLNFEELENSFKLKPKSVPKTDENNDSSSQSVEKKKKSDEVTLLENKRSFQVNIFLRQFRIPTAEVIELLANGQSESLGAEKLRGLRNILPESEEVEMLNNFDGDKTKLGKAESFYLQLLELPHYRLRVEALLMKEEFKQTMEWLKPAIDAIILTSDQIKESAELNEILYTILLAGNFLNSGGYSGDAAGFKLSSLLKLTDVAAHKPRMNLLHFVVQQLEQKNLRLLKIGDEFDSLADAAVHSVETITAEVTHLRDGVKSISEQLEKLDDTSIKDQLENFLDIAGTDLEEFDEDLQQLEKCRESLAGYFCEDAKTFKLEECLNIFKVFFDKFSKAIKENEERKVQEEKAEQRRRQREEQPTSTTKRRQPSGDHEVNGRPASTHSDDGDIPIVDKLLGNIRQGNFSDAPDFKVTKVTKVTLNNNDSILVNGGTQDSDTNSATSTPNIKQDILRSNSLRHSGGRRRSRRLGAINEDRLSGRGKVRSEELSNELEPEELLTFLLTEGERPLTRRGSVRNKKLTSSNLSLDRDRAPSPTVQVVAESGRSESRWLHASPKARTSPPLSQESSAPSVPVRSSSVPAPEPPVEDFKPRITANEPPSIDTDKTLPSTSHESTETSVSKILEQVRLRSLAKIQKGEITVSQVIAETGVTDPTLLINANGESEHNNNVIPRKSQHRLLSEETEPYTPSLLDNFDEMIEKKKAPAPKPVQPVVQSIREKYLKYLPGAQQEEASTTKPHVREATTSQQSRYERFRAKFSQNESESETDGTSRFSRASSATMPTRICGGRDVRLAEEPSDEGPFSRSAKFTRPSRLKGQPMMPSALTRAAWENERLDENVHNYLQNSSDDRSRLGNRLQRYTDLYSTPSISADTPSTIGASSDIGGVMKFEHSLTDSSYRSEPPPASIGESASGASVSVGASALVGKPVVKGDREDSHSEASSKDEGFESHSESQRTSMSSNLEQEIHKENDASHHDDSSKDDENRSVDISRSVDSLVRNPCFAIAGTVNIDELPSDNEKSANSEALSTTSSDTNRTITNTPDRELNTEAPSSAPKTPTRTTSKYESEKASLPPTPKSGKTASKVAAKTSSVFSRLTSDRRAKPGETKETKSTTAAKSASADAKSRSRTRSGGSGASTPTSRRKTLSVAKEHSATSSPISPATPKTVPKTSSTLSASSGGTTGSKPKKPIGAARPSLASSSSDTPGRRPAKPSLYGNTGVRSPGGDSSRSGSRNSSRQGSTDDLSNLSTTSSRTTFVRGGYGRQTMPASMRFNKNRQDADKSPVPVPPERTTSIRPGSKPGSANPGTARRVTSRSNEVAPDDAPSSGVSDKKKRASAGSNVFARLMSGTSGRRSMLNATTKSSKA